MDLISIIRSLTTDDVLKNFPDGIIIINSSHKVLFMNTKAKSIFGVSARESMNMDITEIFNNGITHALLSSDKNDRTVLKAYSKLLGEIFVEVTFSETEFNEQIILSVRDVTTSHKTMNNILADYENLKKTINTKASYITSLDADLRNPIHSIIGFSQALLDGLGGHVNEKQGKYISIIKRNADSLLKVVGSLLDISQFEANQKPFNYRTFDIINTINSVAEVVSEQAESKKLDFNVDLSNIVRKNCYSDENMIKRILSIILDNAVKFTDSGSIQLNVSHPDLEFVQDKGINVPGTQTDKSFLLFSITDTGIGLSSKDFKTIFTEYRSVDKAIAKKYGGSGLELAITKKIVTQLGGVIWAEGEPLQGATFSFIIPIEKVITE